SALARRTRREDRGAVRRRPGLDRLRAFVRPSHAQRRTARDEPRARSQFLAHGRASAAGDAVRLRSFLPVQPQPGDPGGLRARALAGAQALLAVVLRALRPAHPDGHPDARALPDTVPLPAVELDAPRRELGGALHLLAELDPAPRGADLRAPAVRGSPIRALKSRMGPWRLSRWELAAPRSLSLNRAWPPAPWKSSIPG